MKTAFKKSALSVALAASVIGSATWSTASYACAVEAYIASVCVMATPGLTQGFGGGAYLLAAGQQLSVNNYQAVYALIGTTYGGTQNQTFNLPDMRGRVLVGAGVYTDASGSKQYLPGQKGGALTASGTATLNLGNLPAHYHTLVTPPVPPTSGTGVVVASGVGTLKVSLAGLTTTTTAGTLAGTMPTATMNASAVASALSLNGSTGSASATASQTPSSSVYLGSPAAKIYNSATPRATLAPGSLSGTGTIPVNFTGTNIPITGAPTVTVTGIGTITGMPSVAISGATEMAGYQTPAPVTVNNISTMPPYLSMYYFIAVQGLFPTSN